ncbi:porin family protein [uncultured Pontibacter sp.]|uniref:type IX secretion/gliding motility protein PorT/SprT n=1 Tax=uncultured Pontibacter sp. TaxID=453356 RepID=UPI00263543DD|nr:porin family protein [uncultured Pontibacter sp.]
MAFTHIRNQFDLHRQKIVFLGFVLAMLFGTQAAQAQKKIKQQNKAGYDDKIVHYGFYLAVPLTKYNIQHSQDYADQLANDPGGAGSMAINAKVSPGFYTGLVLDVRLAEYLSARFVPGVGFYGRSIEYANAPQETGERGDVVKTISSTMVELPLLLKYKAKRRGNFRMYLVGGIKPGLDLGSTRSGDDVENELLVDNFDLALEYGFGVDIFYPYFKFAPEIRFSHGLINQHVANPSLYNTSIQKMTNHNVSLILFFE